MKHSAKKTASRAYHFMILNVCALFFVHKLPAMLCCGWGKKVQPAIIEYRIPSDCDTFQFDCMEQAVQAQMSTAADTSYKLSRNQQATPKEILDAEHTLELAIFACSDVANARRAHNQKKITY